MKRYLIGVLLILAGSRISLAVCPVSTLNVKVLLEGPFNPSTGQMNTALKLVSTFPLTQPYGNPPFAVRSSTGTESTTPAVLAGASVVDWILIELRNKADGSEVFFTAAGLLLADGSVVNPSTGTGGLLVKVPEDDYYIAVAHRNHLRIRTAAVQHVGPASPLSLDFTTGVLLLEESSPGTAQVALPNGSHGMRAGNANQNGNVRYNGPANDRDAVLSYLGFNEIGFVSNVYAAEDLNLDGIVRYNGPGNDRDALLSYLGYNEIGFVAGQTAPGSLSASIPECSPPTPVTWAYFSATPEGKAINVGWATYTERNSAFFEVQYSADGSLFEPLGRVMAVGTSQRKNIYSFRNTPQSPGPVHYYRLKQVDRDGTFVYSKVLSVQMEDYSAFKCSVVSHLFNSGEINLLIERAEPNLPLPTTVELFDLAGRLVGSQQIVLNTGMNNVRFDSSGAGVYLVSIKNARLFKPLIKRVVRF